MLIRRILVWWAGLLTVLGGCTVMCTGGCTGIYSPPPHPQVRLLSAAVSPSAGLRPGQEILITAQTNQTTSECQMVLRLYLKAYQTESMMMYPGTFNEPVFETTLRDDGGGSDDKAFDGTWTGRIKLPDYQSGIIEPHVTLFFRKRFNGRGYSPQSQLLPEMPFGAGDARQDAR